MWQSFTSDMYDDDDDVQLLARSSCHLDSHNTGMFTALHSCCTHAAAIDCIYMICQCAKRINKFFPSSLPCWQTRIVQQLGSSISSAKPSVHGCCSGSPRPTGTVLFHCSFASTLTRCSSLTTSCCAPLTLLGSGKLANKLPQHTEQL